MNGGIRLPTEILVRILQEILPLELVSCRGVCALGTFNTVALTRGL